jgi:hypothetical protein
MSDVYAQVQREPIAYPKLALDQGQCPQAIPNVPNRVSWAGGWQSRPRGSILLLSVVLLATPALLRNSIHPFGQVQYGRYLRIISGACLII